MDSRRIDQQRWYSARAPNVFWDQSIDKIHKVIGVNVVGVVNVTYAVLRLLMVPVGKGTILNISSVTGLEVPSKGMGEVSNHSSRAFLEGLTNALRNETIGTDIRILTLRPGFVRTNFHFDRVGKDQSKFEDVFKGMEALSPDDVAEAALYRNDGSEPRGKPRRPTKRSAT